MRAWQVSVSVSFQDKDFAPILEYSSFYLFFFLFLFFGPSLLLFVFFQGLL